MSFMNDSMAKKRVVLGVTGSVAAYKSAELARLLISRGYEVRTVLTRSGAEFVSATTFEAITNSPVMTDFWRQEGRDGIEHISWADWADVVVVAPATADLLAKMANGQADSPLLALLLATKSPIVVAPAMNVNMYQHPATQANLKVLKERCVQIVEPEDGALACGWEGVGRLASTWEIFYNLERALSGGDLYGQKVLVVTGPTREALDPVRYLSNRSSGKMGVCLAREAFRRGATVTVVHGPIACKVAAGIKRIPVTTALEMQSAIDQVRSEQGDFDIIVMAAAVSDFRPSDPVLSKIKRQQAPKSIAVTANPDILTGLSEQRGKAKLPRLIGFAVETGEVEDLLQAIRHKLDSKGIDLVVGNLAEDSLDKSTNRVWLLDRGGRVEEVATTYKSRVAVRIFDRIVKLG